ncbi:MAG: hypothetical protein WAT81_05785 [Candidatus Moraniibacteriota bacterium]
METIQESQPSQQPINKKQLPILAVSVLVTTVIRRNFYFKPLESQIILEQPNIITPERKGFTVVEWGGLLDK